MMEFNYLSVAVTGKEISFKLNRWRPDCATPFQACWIDKWPQISGCD